MMANVLPHVNHVCNLSQSLEIQYIFLDYNFQTHVANMTNVHVVDRDISPLIIPVLHILIWEVMYPVLPCVSAVQKAF